MSDCLTLILTLTLTRTLTLTLSLTLNLSLTLSLTLTLTLALTLTLLGFGLDTVVARRQDPGLCYELYWGTIYEAVHMPVMHVCPMGRHAPSGTWRFHFQPLPLLNCILSVNQMDLASAVSLPVSRGMFGMTAHLYNDCTRAGISKQLALTLILPLPYPVRACARLNRVQPCKGGIAIF